MTNMEKAAAAYEKLLELKSKEWAHRKINNCLPLKKRKQQEAILTQLMVKIINARTQFRKVYSKLSSTERGQFAVGRKAL